ncbi:MAG: hypothetical protein HQL56_07015 [Magnetococcales bacterium]|nr:hypothetical protein [Magnetococcales bacterium]
MLRNVIMAGLAGLMGLSMPGESAPLEEVMFRDDFNREGVLGQGWLNGRLDDACAKAADRPVGAVNGSNAVALRNKRLHFTYGNSGYTLYVRRDIIRQVSHLEYDFVPIHVMGGPDDQARIGVRVQFLDQRGSVLGEIEHFYYAAATPEAPNTPTHHATSLRGPFDHQVHHAVLEVDTLLRRHLTGVDRSKIQMTRISFEQKAHWCGSTVEGAIDNVDVYGFSEPLFAFNPEEVAEITKSAQEYHRTRRGEFPQVWVEEMRRKYGPEKINLWAKAMASRMDKKPGDFTRMVEEVSGVTGAELFTTGFVLGIVADYVGRAGKP